MSFSTLPLFEIEPDQSVTWQTVIDPQWLRSQIKLSFEKKQDEKQSLSILNAARRKAKKIVRDSEHSQLKLKKKWEVETAIFRRSMLEELESEWLAKHVKRLCDEETIHRQYVDQAANFISKSLEQVLVAWFDQQPTDSTLCHRLAKQAQLMAKEGVLKLRIHPERLPLMKENFGERFLLIADPDFAPDCAELSSEQYSVEFSLSNHFQQLLTWLRHADGPGGADEF